MSQVGISISQLSGVINAALPKVDKDLVETQRWNRMPGNRLLIDNGVEEDTTGNVLSWTVRMRDAQGTTQVLRPFQVTQYSVQYGSQRFSVPFRDKVNTAFAFDRLEIARNRAAPNRIYDLIKERRSMQLENIANTNEVEVFGAPDDNDDDTAIFGLECWLRRSMDASGNFIANPEGGFDGVYWRGRQGAVHAILGGVDISSLANERARTYVQTIDGVMGPALIEGIKKALNETEFEMIPGLTGITTSSGGSDECMIFWDPRYDEDYSNLLARGPDNRYQGGKGDYFPGRSETLYGATLVRTPVLAYKPDRPIFGVRRGMIEVCKGRGMWMVDGEGVVPGAHNSHYKPRDYTWQMRARHDMRKIGFRLHTSFATGT